MCSAYYVSPQLQCVFRCSHTVWASVIHTCHNCHWVAGCSQKKLHLFMFPFFSASHYCSSVLSVWCLFLIQEVNGLASGAKSAWVSAHISKKPFEGGCLILDSPHRSHILFTWRHLLWHFCYVSSWGSSVFHHLSSSHSLSGLVSVSISPVDAPSLTCWLDSLWQC